MAKNSSGTTFDIDDTIKRSENSYRKLRGSTFWVLTANAAAKLIQEQFAPDPRRPPFYIPVGNEVQILKDLLRDSVPVVLTGPPGIGKTTLIEAVFHELGIPLQTFVASASTQTHELLGRQGTGGERGDLAVWTDGKLSMAARASEGGFTNGVYLDEVINLPGNVASCMYSILDNRQSLPLPTGEEIFCGKRLKTVFSYNPSRTTKLEPALHSRLTAIRIGYPPEKVEVQLLMDQRRGRLHRVSNGESVAKGMTRFANTVRHAFGTEVNGDFVSLSESENDLVRIVPSPPSSRSLIVASRMIATGGYNTADAIANFIIPSLVQDVHDFELNKVLDLLKRLATETMVEAGAVAAGSTTVHGEIDSMMEQYERVAAEQAEAKDENIDPDAAALAEEILREWRQKKVEGRILVGTSGFSYEDWRGRWYEPGVTKSRMLEAYAEVFDALEINATYYRTPPRSAAESMVRRAAGRLSFAVKAPGDVTHKRLVGGAVVDPFLRFLDPFVTAGVLGPVLFQFPNAFHFDRNACSFLRSLAGIFQDIPVAYEFRHSSWDSKDADSLVRELADARVVVDQPALRGLSASAIGQEYAGSYPMGYYRFHGRNAEAWYAREGDGSARYRYAYSDAELAPLASLVRENAGRAKTTYAFFNNHPDGAAPRNAETFASLLNVPLRGSGYRDLFG